MMEPEGKYNINQKWNSFLHVPIIKAFNLDYSVFSGEEGAPLSEDLVRSLLLRCSSSGCNVICEEAHFKFIS